jgi:hypothetical protein
MGWKTDCDVPAMGWVTGLMGCDVYVAWPPRYRLLKQDSSSKARGSNKNRTNTVFFLWLWPYPLYP